MLRMESLTLQKRLAELIDAQLKPSNFRRRKFNWFSCGSRLYRVCNLQKSTWSDDGCYVNLGFSPSEQAVKGWLAESQCWVRFRAEALRSICMEDLRLLDRDAIEATGEHRWAVDVAERIVRPIADVLAEPKDLPSLAVMLQTKVSNRVLIHRDLRGTLYPDTAAGSAS